TALIPGCELVRAERARIRAVAGRGGVLGETNPGKELVGRREDVGRRKLRSIEVAHLRDLGGCLSRGWCLPLVHYVLHPIDALERVVRLTMDARRYRPLAG